MRPTALVRMSRARPTMSSFSSLPRQVTATRISTAPTRMVHREPRVLLRCEVALITPSSTGLVAARTKLKWAGLGSHPVPYSALVR